LPKLLHQEDPLHPSVVLLELARPGRTPTWAVIGSRADERQTSLEMKVTALPGKVITAAAVVAFLIAVAVKATLWPFAVFVVPAGVSGLAGWAIYRQDGNGDDDRMDAEHTRSPIRVKPGP